MTIDLKHSIHITAPIERIYEGITTPDGIRAWSISTNAAMTQPD